MEQAGSEGEKFLLISLLENIDHKELKDKAQTSSRVTFLAEQIKEYSLHQSFLNYFPEVIAESTDADKA